MMEQVTMLRAPETMIEDVRDQASRWLPKLSNAPVLLLLTS